MTKRSIVWLSVLLASLCTVQPPVSAEDSVAPAKILMITQSAGYVHGSVKRPEGQLSPAEIAMTQLGQMSKEFTVTCSQNVKADFTIENLKNYDIVFFYTTGNLGIDEATLKYFFEDWLKQKGHGFVGAHSATDTYGDYQPYWDMIGGTFNGHPWNAGETVTISVHDTKHPGSKMFGSEFQIKDEIYQYKNWQPEKVHVLMSLNMEKCPTKKPYHVPVSWVKEYGNGRVFYTNLGHNEATWQNKQFLESIRGGIRWIRHLEEGDSKPNPDLSAAQEEKAKKDAPAN